MQSTNFYTHGKQLNTVFSTKNKDPLYQVSIHTPSQIRYDQEVSKIDKANFAGTSSNPFNRIARCVLQSNR